jgi:dimethylaniline monooxygenase (N-oxide forming)
MRRKQLPSKEEMLQNYTQEMKIRWEKGLKKHQAHIMGEEQHEYYADLAITAGLKPLQPVMSKLHNFSSLRFLDDLINFRKDVFRILDDEVFVKVVNEI